MARVVALFETQGAARTARTEVLQEGVQPSQAEVITSDPQAAYQSAPQSGVEVPGGCVTGTGVGGAVGGAMGWLADTLDLVTVELAPAFASDTFEVLADAMGPVAAAGVGMGALAGGLLGAYAGWSAVEGRARFCQRWVATGRALLTVKDVERRQVQRVTARLRRAGAAWVGSSQ